MLYLIYICFINMTFMFSDECIDGQRMLVVLFLKIHRVYGHGNLHLFFAL